MKYFIGLVFGLLAVSSFAQCAMCKATAEQSNYASGINEGILYLMPLPALLMAIIGTILYINYKKKLKQETE